MKHLTKQISIGILAAIAGMSVSAAAEEAKAPKWYDKLGVSGFIDTYYQVNFNGLSGAGSGAIVGRAFDYRQNEFSFSGAKISISGTDSASGVGGVLDLMYGPTSILVTGGPVEQAFLTYVVGPVSLKFGKMVTHVGYEVIETPLNLNYSRSLLFNQVPFYHVGVMASVSPLQGLGVMLGAANANSAEQANDEAKDVAAQISYTAIPGLGVIANYYLESNRTAAGLQPFENTHYLELVANYQAMETLGLGLDYLYKSTIASSDKDETGTPTGDINSPKVQGYALYANYITPLPGFSIIPRFEQLYMPDIEGIAFDYTLTLKYATGPLTHFLEIRSDVAYPGPFLPKAGDTELKSTQMTLTYGATYTF